MSESWSSMRQVPQQMLQERLQTVKSLYEDERGAELYEIVKDTQTGEHYLHYAYMHVTVADGTEESFHQLLPLESDDVLGMMFGELGFTYPDHWQKPFLRNGPNETYVWFDPSSNLEGADDDKERLAGEIAGMLGRWKQEGRHDPESVKELFARIDQAIKREEQP